MTTHLPAQTPLGREGRPFRLLTIAAFLAVAFAPLAQAQAPAAATAAVTAQSPAELEKLVDRIALYPDDLVTIILPAATNPLQLVQADRYLDKRKKDPKLPLDDKWDDAVKSLLNYPEVVKMMSNDLDWTSDLGEAVVADQGAVLDAVQAFRRKTQAAGNLKSDTKQVVVVEKEVIKIVPADPQVIYVPQYNPSTVVVYGGYSSWGYYPAPYPVYYYPYPPGAALATGLIWGAAIGAAWSGNRYGWGSNNDININNSTNINRGGNTVNRPASGTGAGQRPAGGGSGSSQWKSNKTPGQVSGSVGKTPSGGRVGNASPSAGGGARPSTQPAGGGAGIGGGSRPSTQPAGGGRDYGGGRDSGGGAFGGSSASGRQTQMDSSRGAASRNSMSGGGASRAGGGYSGGGGARAGGGGGGGGRAGGGGGRGGGGRR